MVELAYIHCTVAANSPGATIGYVGQDDDEMLCSLSCVSCGPVDLLYISKLILDANQLAVSRSAKGYKQIAVQDITYDFSHSIFFVNFAVNSYESTSQELARNLPRGFPMEYVNCHRHEELKKVFRRIVYSILKPQSKLPSSEGFLSFNPSSGNPTQASN